MIDLSKKKLTALDKLIISFSRILERANINYVIVSGYVPIVFGRSRITEDIDVLVESISKKKFKVFWNFLKKSKFYCLNTSNLKRSL